MFAHTHTNTLIFLCALHFISKLRYVLAASRPSERESGRERSPLQIYSRLCGCVCVCMNIHDLFMHIYVSSDFLLLFFTCALFQSASLSRCSSLTLSSPYTCCCLFPASCNALFAHALTQPLSHSPALSSPWLHFKLFTLANVTRCVRKFFYLCSVQTCVLFARQFVVASRERGRGERACTGWLRCCSLDSIAVCAVSAVIRKNTGGASWH